MSKVRYLNIVGKTATVVIIVCSYFVQPLLAGTIVGWGRNDDGRATPPEGNDYVAVAAGKNHGVALKSNGSIVCWGQNDDGQATPPVGNDFVKIAAGDNHSLALKMDGSIVGWGSNDDGEATPPIGNDFTAMAAGSSHSLALKADGSIVGWGSNTANEATPPAGYDFIAIAAGLSYSLALKSDNSIMGWGNSANGQATPPVGNDYIAIAAGSRHSLALKSNLSIVGWGQDTHGRATPPLGNDFVAISAGVFHSVALKSNGSLVSWGISNGSRYDHGQVTDSVDGYNCTAISTAPSGLHSLVLTKYGGGGGTAEDPYQIWTAEQMDAIGADPNDWDKHFVLMDDIDLSSYTGTEFNLIGVIEMPFSGVFEGNHHTISNFTFTDPTGYPVGLFGVVKGQDAGIQNLSMINAHVVGNKSVGIIAGVLTQTVATHCMVSGTVSGELQVGGIAGVFSHTEVTDCYSNANVSGTERVGGFVGFCFASEISNCYSTGSVAGSDLIGGLVGQYSSRMLSNCYWDIGRSNQQNMCGNPEDPDCNNSHGLPTHQLHQQSTFTDWDFINVWNIGENQTYPYLRTHPASDLNKDRAVNLIDLSIMAEQWMEE